MPQENRSELILKHIVQQYVQGGQPVASTVLAKQDDLKVSSATIRNVMKDLEEKGLIHSPHTSAGRIPTAKGYRLFVDSFVRATPINEKVLQSMHEEFSQESDPQLLLNKASEALSSMTQFAGVVMLPNQNAGRLRQIEFMPLSGNRVLSILVTDDGRVQNRVIQLSKEYTDSNLVEAANYFNETYIGKSIDQVRGALLSDIEDSSVEDGGDVVLTGEQKLLDVPDLCQVETLQKLFNVFKTKQDLLDLLDRSMKTDGVNIFIGEESGYSSLDDCSVVTKTYESEGEIVGTLGVIGPTRMMYSDVVSVVDITSTLLSKALKS